MAAKNAKITLRNGVTRAVLPNNVTMVPGKHYLISLDDLRKFSRKVRETIIEVETIGTSDTVVSRPDLTAGYFDLAVADGNDEAGWLADGYKPGQVVQGLNGSAFKLVKFVGPESEEEEEETEGNFSAGDALCWLDKVAGTVGASETGEFAGVAIADTDFGAFGFVQIEGTATVSGSLSAGKTAAADDSAGVEAADDETASGRILGTVLSSAAGTLEVALRNDKARGRHFKRPNLFLSSDF